MNESELIELEFDIREVALCNLYRDDCIPMAELVYLLKKLNVEFLEVVKGVR